MREQTTEQPSRSRPTWDAENVRARERIQGWLQHLLDEEVTEVLGREKLA